MMPSNIKKYLILTLKTVLAAFVLFFGYYWLFLRPDVLLWKNVKQNEEVLVIQKNYLSQSRIILVELIKADVNNPYYPTYLKSTLEILAKINNSAREKTAKEITYEPILSLGRKHIRAYNRNILSGIQNIAEKNKIFLKEQKEFLDSLQSKNYYEQKDFLVGNKAVVFLTKQTNLILEYDYWLKKITNLKKN